jgi:hypothetical protein
MTSFSELVHGSGSTLPSLARFPHRIGRIARDYLCDVLKLMCDIPERNGAVIQVAMEPFDLMSACGNLCFPRGPKAPGVHIRRYLRELVVMLRQSSSHRTVDTTAHFRALR